MKGLKYVSWADNTGYAVAAKSYIRALVEIGVHLTWTPMLPCEKGYETQTVTTWPCPHLGPLCNRVISYDTVLIHTVPEYYPEWITRERAQGKRVLGYTVWEHEELPDHWPDILNRLDGVLVPCRWNVDVFRRSGVTVPIHVVPHLSQFEFSHPVTPEQRQTLQSRLGAEPKEGRFVFYTIGTWSNRKAPYLVVEAYLRTFDSDDPVALIVKTSKNDITRMYRHWRNGFRRRLSSPVLALKKQIAKFSRPALVVAIDDETLSDGELLALHERGDCFVSLTRGEGWGLGAFEAARMGKPVVMTGYGGQRDFLAPELAYLVDYRMVPVHEPIWPANYRPTDMWAEPSLNQAGQYMRDILENRAIAAAKAQKLANSIADRFSRQAVMETMIRALN